MLDLAAIVEHLTANARTVVPELAEADISPSSRLADLGCNSIDRADIVTMTMDGLGIAVPAMEFHSGQRISELAEVFLRYSPAGAR